MWITTETQAIEAAGIMKKILPGIEWKCKKISHRDGRLTFVVGGVCKNTEQIDSVQRLFSAFVILNVKIDSTPERTRVIFEGYDKARLTNEFVLALFNQNEDNQSQSPEAAPSLPVPAQSFQLEKELVAVINSLNINARSRIDNQAGQVRINLSKNVLYRKKNDCLAEELGYAFEDYINIFKQGQHTDLIIIKISALRLEMINSIKTCYEENLRAYHENESLQRQELLVQEKLKSAVAEARLDEVRSHLNSVKDNFKQALNVMLEKQTEVVQLQVVEGRLGHQILIINNQSDQREQVQMAALKSQLEEAKTGRYKAEGELRQAQKQLDVQRQFVEDSLKRIETGVDRVNVSVVDIAIKLSSLETTLTEMAGLQTQLLDIEKGLSNLQQASVINQLSHNEMQAALSRLETQLADMGVELTVLHEASNDNENKFNEINGRSKQLETKLAEQVLSQDERQHMQKELMSLEVQKVALVEMNRSVVSRMRMLKKDKQRLEHQCNEQQIARIIKESLHEEFSNIENGFVDLDVSLETLRDQVHNMDSRVGDILSNQDLLMADIHEVKEQNSKVEASIKSMQKMVLATVIATTALQLTLQELRYREGHDESFFNEMKTDGNEAELARLREKMVQLREDKARVEAKYKAKREESESLRKQLREMTEYRGEVLKRLDTVNESVGEIATELADYEKTAKQRADMLQEAVGEVVDHSATDIAAHREEVEKYFDALTSDHLMTHEALKNFELEYKRRSDIEFEIADRQENRLQEILVCLKREEDNPEQCAILNKELTEAIKDKAHRESIFKINEARMFYLMVIQLLRNAISSSQLVRYENQLSDRNTKLAKASGIVRSAGDVVFLIKPLTCLIGGSLQWCEKKRQRLRASRTTLVVESAQQTAQISVDEFTEQLAFEITKAYQRQFSCLEEGTNNAVTLATAAVDRIIGYMKHNTNALLDAKLDLMAQLLMALRVVTKNKKVLHTKAKLMMKPSLPMPPETSWTAHGFFSCTGIIIEGKRYVVSVKDQKDNWYLGKKQKLECWSTRVSCYGYMLGVEFFLKAIQPLTEVVEGENDYQEPEYIPKLEPLPEPGPTPIPEEPNPGPTPAPPQPAPEPAPEPTSGLESDSDSDSKDKTGDLSDSKSNRGDSSDSGSESDGSVGSKKDHRKRAGSHSSSSSSDDNSGRPKHKDSFKGGAHGAMFQPAERMDASSSDSVPTLVKKGGSKGKRRGSSNSGSESEVSVDSKKDHGKRAGSHSSASSSDDNSGRPKHKDSFKGGAHGAMFQPAERMDASSSDSVPTLVKKGGSPSIL